MKNYSLLSLLINVTLSIMLVGCMSIAPEEAAVEYPELTIDPVVVTSLGANENVQYYTEGGKEPYTYTVVSGPGNVGMKSGFFTAGTEAGAVKVIVEDALGNSAIATVNVISNEPFKLEISGENEILTAECEPLTLRAVDSDGNNARRSQSRDIIFSGDALGAGAGMLYSDDACSDPLDGGGTEFVLQEGDTDDTFYYQNNDMAGSILNLVAESTGLSEARHEIEMIESGVATQYSIVDVTNSIPVGVTGRDITVQAQIATGSLASAYFGNVKVVLTSVSGLAFVANSGELEIRDGVGSIHIHSEEAEVVTISLERLDPVEDDIIPDDGYTDTEEVTFSPDSASKVKFVDLPVDPIAGTPTSIKIITVDASDNPVTYEGDITLVLTDPNVNGTAVAVEGILIDLHITNGEIIVDINDIEAEIVGLSIDDTADLTYDNEGAAKSVEFIYGTVDKYVVLPIVDTPVGGTANVIVQAQDRNGNRVMNFVTGSVDIEILGDVKDNCSVLINDDGQSGATDCQVSGPTVETVAVTLSNPDGSISVSDLTHGTVTFTVNGFHEYVIREKVASNKIVESSFELVIEAVDDQGNIISDYNCASMEMDADYGRWKAFPSMGAFVITNGVGTIDVTADTVARNDALFSLSSSCAGSPSSYTMAFLASTVTHYTMTVVTSEAARIAGALIEIKIEAKDKHENVNTSATAAYNFSVDLSAEGDVLNDAGDTVTNLDVVVSAGTFINGLATFYVTGQGPDEENVPLILTNSVGANSVTLPGDQLITILP